MKQTSIQSQSTNSRKPSFACRIAAALLCASICVQAGATECSRKAQALGKCPQPAIREPAPTSVLPLTTAAPTSHPSDTAGKHGIIFVGGRVGPQGDTRTINSQPVPPGHGVEHSINSQPVPPGRVLRRRPPHGSPVENDGH